MDEAIKQAEGREEGWDRDFAKKSDGSTNPKDSLLAVLERSTPHFVNPTCAPTPI